MKSFRERTILTGMLLCLAAAGCRKPAPHPPAVVSATNSYLGCAVKDLLGGDEPVFMLAGPGMCPGHFDVRPSQVQAMRRCRVILRFDFQESLDAKLALDSEASPIVAAVAVPGGLCEPASYLAACTQVAKALVDAGLLESHAADERLVQIGERMATLEESCRDQLAGAGLTGAPVLASTHQAGFCGALRLRVVATFSGADEARFSQIEHAIQAGRDTAVALVIANRPEGRKQANALAGRLAARVVVFENFPGEPSPRGFDEMVRGNISRLQAGGME